MRNFSFKLDGAYFELSLPMAWVSSAKSFKFLHRSMSSSNIVSSWGKKTPNNDEALKTNTHDRDWSKSPHIEVRQNPYVLF